VLRTLGILSREAKHVALEVSNFGSRISNLDWLDASIGFGLRQPGPERTGGLGFEPRVHVVRSHWGGNSIALQPRLFPSLMPQTRLSWHRSGIGVALPILHPICTQSTQRKGQARLRRPRRSSHYSRVQIVRGSSRVAGPDRSIDAAGTAGRLGASCRSAHEGDAWALPDVDSHARRRSAATALAVVAGRKPRRAHGG
jgi:hypothetical protein